MNIHNARCTDMVSQGKNTVNTLMLALMQTSSDAAKENMPSSFFLQASRLARLAFFSESGFGGVLPLCASHLWRGGGGEGGTGISMSVCPPTCLSVCPD